jgi:hypothetical protein
MFDWLKSENQCRCHERLRDVPSMCPPGPEWSLKKHLLFGYGLILVGFLLYLLLCWQSGGGWYPFPQPRPEEAVSGKR